LLSRGLRVSPEIDVVALSLQAAMVRRGLEMRSGYESGGGNSEYPVCDGQVKA
jgi:hypothetical protein